MTSDVRVMGAICTSRLTCDAFFVRSNYLALIPALVKILHTLILREVCKFAGNCILFRHSKFLVDVFSIHDEEEEENAQDDVDDYSDRLRV